MNLENKGLNIAKIRSREYEKDFDEVPIYITDQQKEIKALKHEMDEIHIPEDCEDEEVIQLIPYQDLKAGNTRQILYVSGASGSGKSYYSASYIKEYIKMFPKNKILLFSSVSEDKKLDKFKQLIRVKLDEEFYNRRFKIEDFENTLVIYDDTETIANPFIKEKLKNIMNLILTTGRHKSVFVIITSHITNAGHSTKMILTEAHSITLFLRTIGNKTLKYVLEGSFGFDKHQIKKIKQLDSRWVCVLKTYPMVVLHEKGMYTI